MMAVLHGQDESFGSAIRNEIERRSGRAVSRGAVYITLDRLEEKGLLSSSPGGASDARGGRPKRLFRVTAFGLKSLRHSLTQMKRMHAGLEPLLGDL
jgi:DNA-binding PadR family transcriptional regulator